MVIPAFPSDEAQNSGDRLRMNNGGDVLARGGKSAQFGGATIITDFENDFIYMSLQEVCTKYGLSEAEYDQYAAVRLSGDKLPDIQPVGSQELDSGFSIQDHRKNYMSEVLHEDKVQEQAPKKFPDSTYEKFCPILDRILVMRISDDPEEELLEDGSTRNKRSGLVTAAKYRQHSNVGIVLGTGKHVVLSGMLLNMSEFVKPGDKVTYGDYNSEVFPMDEKKAEALCDALQVNYTKDPNGIRIVRVQDVRGVERKNASEVTNV
jgi:co-chaperonin GroES (HSP10)